MKINWWIKHWSTRGLKDGLQEQHQGLRRRHRVETTDRWREHWGSNLAGVRGRWPHRSAVLRTTKQCGGENYNFDQTLLMSDHAPGLRRDPLTQYLANCILYSTSWLCDLTMVRIYLFRLTRWILILYCKTLTFQKWQGFIFQNKIMWCGFCCFLFFKYCPHVQAIVDKNQHQRTHGPQNTLSSSSHFNLHVDNRLTHFNHIAKIVREVLGLACRCNAAISFTLIFAISSACSMAFWQENWFRSVLL